MPALRQQSNRTCSCDVACTFRSARLRRGAGGDGCQAARLTRRNRLDSSTSMPPGARLASPTRCIRIRSPTTPPVISATTGRRDRSSQRSVVCTRSGTLRKSTVRQVLWASAPTMLRPPRLVAQRTPSTWKTFISAGARETACRRSARTPWMSPWAAPNIKLVTACCCGMAHQKVGRAAATGPTRARPGNSPSWGA